MSEQPKLSPEAQKAMETQAIQAKVNELKNISRLVVNTLNLICSNDIKIPSAYAKPVSEIQDWLTGMHQNLQQNLNILAPMLPAEPNAPKADAQAVDAPKSPVVDQGSAKAVALEVVDSAKSSKKVKEPK